MGLLNIIGGLFGIGSGNNAVKEVAEVFTVNKEAQSQRDAGYRDAVLQQFAAEFVHERRGLFDRFVDALNRLPRPVMALGTIGLIVSAMAAPEWFQPRMAGLALVPEPLWWLMGAVVSFYFGARYQSKEKEFQKDLVKEFGRFRAAAHPPVEDIPVKEEPIPQDEPERTSPVAVAPQPTDPFTHNAALADWRGEQST